MITITGEPQKPGTIWYEETPETDLLEDSVLVYVRNGVLLLAPLRPNDDTVLAKRKMALVARYVDILLAWRLWNFRSIAYSTMQYALHRILARLTDHVETQSGQPSRYAEFVAEGPNRFEIEHIWADYFERHTDEFGQSESISNLNGLTFSKSYA
jgi:hypothetical protein